MSKRYPLIAAAMFIAIFLLALAPLPASSSPTALTATPNPGLPFGGPANVVHGLYFYSVDCSHCMAVLTDLIQPLQAQYGSALDLRLLEIATPANYELMALAEDTFQVSAAERDIPVLVLGDQIMIGETAIRSQAPDQIARAAALGGLDWPAIPGLDPAQLVSTVPGGVTTATACPPTGGDGCAAPLPIYAAYFYQTGCKECSMVDVDLQYLREKYPQLIIEEFNIFDDAALGEWLAERAGRDDFHSPALFIGDQAFIDQQEINPAVLEPVLDALTPGGSTRTWADFDPAAAQNNLLARFRSMGWLAVAFAGLVDGLNPCAFATLVFFVSYLTLSGRKGKAVLAVGLAFTLGVFLAYLVIGLGFYKVLDLMGGWLTTLSRWVYALTALLCLGLAVVSFLDFLKARRGQIEDMTLNLPKPLRMRINATIREGRKTRAYVAGAFVTGILISFLELACTGQIYLPTIIFVSSLPELRLQAVGYLVLYNLLFIVPLAVVFVLAYYGTTSKDLTAFLQQRAASVKLGMMILFITLAAWLGASLLG
ncbi:MAG TPA: cytochrome c biogenesis protein CcdA [Anaerolineaceae bacterium]|nr:cytochrome c biogenesis protein CcdA [Anaerolineaceae bacterium]